MSNIVASDTTLLNKNGVLSAEGVAEADLVLLVTTRPTTGNTLAWAVACERDQWGRAIAGINSLTQSDVRKNYLACNSNQSDVFFLFPSRTCKCCSSPFDC